MNYSSRHIFLLLKITYLWKDWIRNLCPDFYSAFRLYRGLLVVVVLVNVGGGSFHERLNLPAPKKHAEVCVPPQPKDSSHVIINEWQTVSKYSFCLYTFNWVNVLYAVYMNKHQLNPYMIDKLLIKIWLTYLRIWFSWQSLSAVKRHLFGEIEPR